jgi:hypothetical protein
MLIGGLSYMKVTVSHDRNEESRESKTRWFQSLSRDERMELFVSFRNLILGNNPDIVGKRYVRPASDKVAVISLPTT